MAVKQGAKKKKLTESELKLLLRKHQNRLLNQPNVNSVGVGFLDNDPKKEMCIQVTVDKKFEESALESMGVEPLPKTLEGPGGEKVEIHVTERKYEPSYKIVSETRPETLDNIRDRRRSRLDPLVPGVSVSHIEGSAGTIGAIVFDRDTREPHVLSNWHVLHMPTGEIGDKIVQPGPYDDSETDFNYMGRLVRSHLGLAGDCAVARIDNRSHLSEILELGVKPNRIAIAELGDSVVKSGRTTGVTYGVVRRTGVVTKLNYGGNTGVRGIGGFEIALDTDRHDTDDEISEPGDSGSLWMINTQDRDGDVAVGLHFAGEIKTSSDEHAVACNIHSVLEKLNVTFDPGETPRSPESQVFKRLGFDYTSEIQSIRDTSHAAGVESEAAGYEVSPVSIEQLNSIETMLESDPEGTLKKMRDSWNDELTLEQARTVIARTKIALQNPGLAIRNMPELLPGQPLELPPGFGFPGMDLDEIPINPGSNKFEHSDIFGWTIMDAKAFFRDEKHPFRKAADENDFRYELVDGDKPLEIALFSDFGTGLYHYLYIAKQLGGASYPYAIHLEDVAGAMSSKTILRSRSKRCSMEAQSCSCSTATTRCTAAEPTILKRSTGRGITSETVRKAVTSPSKTINF